MLNFDDYETYMQLLDVCKSHNIDPSASLEAEDFFRNLLAEYKGQPDSSSVSSWLEKQIQKNFVAIGDQPRWIQNPEWLFEDGKPMIFVGQIDLPVQNEKILSEIYHDDTCLYVFVGRKGQPRVVIQQF